MERPQYGHYFSDGGLVRGGIFSSLFVAVDKKGLAHLLGISYEVRKTLVCENIQLDNFLPELHLGKHY